MLTPYLTTFPNIEPQSLRTIVGLDYLSAYFAHQYGPVADSKSHTEGVWKRCWLVGFFLRFIGAEPVNHPT